MNKRRFVSSPILFIRFFLACPLIVSTTPAPLADAGRSSTRSSSLSILFSFRHHHRTRSCDFWRRGKKENVLLEMSSEVLHVAKVYRNLLRAVKKHIGNEENKRHFREYVTEEFRKNSITTDLASNQQRIKLAQDYTFLLNSVHHQKDLLFSYNIALDRSDEMKRILGKSAASVGLQLPAVYQP